VQQDPLHGGRWQIAPVAPATRVARRYRPGTLILETEFETAEGAVRIVDLMPPRDGYPDVVRIVQGLRGRVPMELRLIPRSSPDEPRLPTYAMRSSARARLTAASRELDPSLA
jgi:hypothetical protein